MKKIFFTIFMFLPLMMSAQNVLTPEQQLEQAQKQLEEAKKAVEAAKAAKAAAEKAATKSISDDKTNKKDTTPATDLKPGIAKEPSSSTNTWSIPTVEKKIEQKAPKQTLNGIELKEDPKYLEGAISLNKGGKVEFVLNTDANGKSAQQIYDIVYKYMADLAQNKNNINSRMALVNEKEHIIANMMDEWLVFNASFISLDRTEFKYQLVAKIADNALNLTLSRIYYNYEEGRSTGFKDAAENVITDKIALTKKKNDLAKIFGKFRRYTIDRKDQIFKEITELVK